MALNPNFNDFGNENCKIVYLFEVPVGAVFRYNRKWWDKISHIEAHTNEWNFESDPNFEYEFLSIDSSNRFEAVAIENNIRDEIVADPYEFGNQY